MIQNKLTTYLKQPYPQQLKSWEMILGASLLVFFLLSAFQPFGLNSIQQHKLLILIGYMFVTAICLSIKMYLFPLIWKKYYNEDKWTVGKEIFSVAQTVIFITLGNSLYSSLFLFSQLSTLSIAFFLVSTSLIAIFPITFLHFLHQNRLLSNNLKDIEALNTHIKKSQEVIPQSELVIIEGNGKDNITLQTNQLQYIEANGNYVNIHYNEEGYAKKKMLRTTIKQVEECLKQFPSIIRCHRAFIINTNAIKQIKGNSQGYYLLFEGDEKKVPISRTFIKQIKAQIGTINRGKE